MKRDAEFDASPNKYPAACCGVFIWEKDKNRVLNVLTNY
jgi:hypothetical protein